MRAQAASPTAKTEIDLPGTRLAWKNRQSHKAAIPRALTADVAAGRAGHNPRKVTA